jgi:hypothetical protein
VILWLVGKGFSSSDQTKRFHEPCQSQVCELCDRFVRLVCMAIRVRLGVRGMVRVRVRVRARVRLGLVLVLGLG